MLHGAIVILVSLLSEADFFVDGKDLQTFVGATSQSRFFLLFPSFLDGAPAGFSRGGAVSSVLRP